MTNEVNRKFECIECNKTFGKKEHLVRHARSHTQQKPYVCSICSKPFGRRDVLTRHERTAHIEGSKASKKRASITSEDRPLKRPKASTNGNDVGSTNAFRSSSPPPPLTFDIPILNHQNHQHQQLQLQQQQHQQQHQQNSFPQPYHQQQLENLLGYNTFVNPPSINNTSNNNTNNNVNNNDHKFELEEPMFQAPSGEFKGLLDWPESDDGIYEYFDSGVPDSFMLGSGVDYFSVVGGVSEGEKGILEGIGGFNGVASTSNLGMSGIGIPVQPVEPLFPLLPPELLVAEPESNHWNQIAKDWPTHIGTFTTPKRRPQSLGLYPLELDSVHLGELMIALEADSDPTFVLPPNNTATSSPDLKLLSLSLNLFWSFISPTFPIIHRPTFKPTKFPLLTLAMASVGVTYIDNRRARDMGVHLYERLKGEVFFGGLERGGKEKEREYNEVDDNDSGNDERGGEALAMLQTGFLVLLNGCLRGDQMSLHSSNMYLSSLINYAKTLGVFSKSSKGGTFRPADNSEAAWLAWVAAESLQRIGHGLLWQSSYLSGIFHHSASPSIQTLTMSMDFPASQELFAAQTSSEWRVLNACAWIFGSDRRTSVRETVLDLLTGGNVLGNGGELGMDERLLLSTGGKEPNLSLILSMICLVAHTLEHGQVIWDPETRNGRATRMALSSWHRCWSISSIGSGADDMGTMEAFHFANLHVSAPFEAIESVCGRDGRQLSTNSLSVTQLSAWVITPLARRAVLHAGQVWVLCSNAQRRRPGELQLAQIAFQSALLLWVYERFLPPALPSNPTSAFRPLEISAPIDWTALDDSPSSTLSISPASQSIRNFIEHGGPTSLAGVVLGQCGHEKTSFALVGNSNGFGNLAGGSGTGVGGPNNYRNGSNTSTATHILESFASQLEGSSCWGQTGQVIRLLNLLADNE